MIAAGMGFHSFFGASLCLLSLSYLPQLVVGHARLIHPPSRASMWRFGFPSNQPDYNDNQGFCGGRSVLHDTFNGKCGVCGDPWLPKPRKHERGGIYYTGEVTAYYKTGGVITAEVQVTANHKGFFEFRVCPYDKPKIGDLELHENGTMIEVTQSCLDKHILPMANGKGTKYPLSAKSGIGFFKVDLQLPTDLQCDKCLFQWRYKTGNSYGVEADGKSCIGCGNQEEFKACADVVIKPYDGNMPTVRPTKQSGGSDTFKNEHGGDKWEKTDEPVTKQKPGNPTPKTPTTTKNPSDIPVTKQKPGNPVTKTPNTSENHGEVSTKTMEVSTKTTKFVGCRASPVYAKVPGMTEWCNINCSRNFCPDTHCVCNAS